MVAPGTRVLLEFFLEVGLDHFAFLLLRDGQAGVAALVVIGSFHSILF